MNLTQKYDVVLDADYKQAAARAMKDAEITRGCATIFSDHLKHVGNKVAIKEAVQKELRRLGTRDVGEPDLPPMLWKRCQDAIRFKDI